MCRHSTAVFPWNHRSPALWFTGGAFISLARTLSPGIYHGRADRANEHLYSLGQGHCSSWDHGQQGELGFMRAAFGWYGRATWTNCVRRWEKSLEDATRPHSARRPSCSPASPWAGDRAGVISTRLSGGVRTTRATASQLHQGHSSYSCTTCL